MLHPDKFSGDSNTESLLDNATKVSSFCGQAYQTLLNDVHRATYLLLSEYGITALDESGREKDPELAEWVFETRMEIDEAETEEELFPI